MDITCDPESMTPAERSDEVASIMAQGLVRHIQHTPSVPIASPEQSEKTAENRLDLSSELRLSVSQPPNG